MLNGPPALDRDKRVVIALMFGTYDHENQGICFDAAGPEQQAADIRKRNRSDNSSGLPTDQALGGNL
jgi:hypothetical protein